MKSFSNKYLIICSSLLSIFPNLIFSQDLDYKGFPEWSWQQYDTTQFYLYTPSNIQPDQKYPIALFLHGCCGQDYTATLRNAVDPPARMWHEFGENRQEIPTYIIAPKTSRGWDQHLDNLKHVIDNLIENHNGDPQRIYITGFSMGGAGTIAFLQKYPNYFAAALPMGMGFRGDLTKLTDTPIWTNRGENDHYAESLPDSIQKIWALNGFLTDSVGNWITGINPRITTFYGVGHGVQWHAASTQDLTGWAFDKINDGNIYPQIYFETPAHSSTFREGDQVEIMVHASDKDGSITAVRFYVNDQLIQEISESPYRMSITAKDGDQKITATAIDNLGKESTANTFISVDIEPQITSQFLPYACQSAFYQYSLTSVGNGPCIFEVLGGIIPGY